MSPAPHGQDPYDLPVRAFLAGVADRTPAPGGGAVIAATVAGAAALVAMAARFADGFDDVARRADDLCREACDLGVADGVVYGEVLRAARTGTDQGARRAALEAATDVPLDLADRAGEVAKLAARVVDGGRPQLTGDALTGLVLAEAAVRAAAALVSINVAQGGLDPGLVSRAGDLVAEVATHLEGR